MKQVILVVDDEKNNREILGRHLQNCGYLVHAVAGGQEALDFLEKNYVSLILLDLLMPGMDGFEVLKRLKGNARTRTIPVLMLTAVRELKTVVKALESGASDYVTKPFNDVELKARVQAHVRERDVLMRRSRDERVLSLGKLTLELSREVRRIREGVESSLTVIEAAGGEPVKPAASRIRQALVSLPRLIGYLSEYALSTTEEPRVLAWETFIDRLTALGTVGCLSRDQIFEWKVAAHLPVIFVPFNQFCHAVVNLLQAVSQRSPVGATLRMDVTHDDAAVVIRLQEPAASLDAAAKDALFAGDPTAAGPAASIAICRQLLEGMDVVLDVQPGEGVNVWSLRVIASSLTTPGEGDNRSPAVELVGSYPPPELRGSIPEFVPEE